MGPLAHGRNLNALEELLDTGKFQPNLISPRSSIVPHLRAKAAEEDKKTAAATAQPKLTAEEEGDATSSPASSPKEGRGPRHQGTRRCWHGPL